MPQRDDKGHFISTAEKPRRAGTGLGQFASATTPALNKKKSRHLIDDISFSQDFIVCICAWKGRIDDYQPHRKEMEPSANKH